MSVFSTRSVPVLDVAPKPKMRSSSAFGLALPLTSVTVTGEPVIGAAVCEANASRLVATLADAGPELEASRSTESVEAESLQPPGVDAAAA